MQTVGIIGASGFVGSTLVETLLAAEESQVRPFIHNSGNAWRLARHGIELRSIDLLSSSTLAEDLQGCTHIVNCSRGSSEVMIKGLSNLLAACQQVGVERFVHLSSVSVYNGPFPDDPINESFSQYAKKESYGGKKLAQDRLVEEAHRKGLPSVILCPPNISGPYSTFMLNYLQALRTGRLALVDGGHLPCMLVDVQNLVHAIRLAIKNGYEDTGRIFVTDDDEVTWGRLAEGIADLAGSTQPYLTISQSEAVKQTSASAESKGSFIGAMKHLVSSDVRDVLRQDPLLGSVEGYARNFARALPGQIQRRLKSTATAGGGNRNGKNHSPARNYDEGTVNQQLRNVRYDCTRAREILGYRPVVTFNESLQAFRSWYSAYFEWGTEAWDLFQKLQDA